MARGKTKQIVDTIPVKVPIPDRIKKITDQSERSTAMRTWWKGYQLRYEDYKADRADENYVYMVKG